MEIIYIFVYIDQTTSPRKLNLAVKENFSKFLREWGKTRYSILRPKHAYANKLRGTNQIK